MSTPKAESEQRAKPPPSLPRSLAPSLPFPSYITDHKASEDSYHCNANITDGVSGGAEEEEEVEEERWESGG